MKILKKSKYKVKDIIGASELNVCIQGLESLFEELNKIKLMTEKNDKHLDFDDVITRLQKIKDVITI